MTTCDLLDVKEGTKGKVQVANGLGVWRRYWVKFDGNLIRGQVSHDSLVRPDQLAAWRQREADRLLAATKSEEASTAVEPVGGDAGAGAGGGAASQIPAHLLERSKAAKARLLG